MNIKKGFFKSKAVWVAIITGVITSLEAAGISIPPEVYKVLLALGLIAVRDAIG